MDNFLIFQVTSPLLWASMSYPGKGPFSLLEKGLDSVHCVEEAGLWGGLGVRSEGRHPPIEGCLEGGRYPFG